MSPAGLSPLFMPLPESLPSDSDGKGQLEELHLAGTNDDSSAIERMDITVDISDNPSSSELNERVAALFNQIFAPELAVNASQVSLRQMSGAMSSRVYIATIDPAPTVPMAWAPRMLRASTEKHYRIGIKHNQETIQMPRKYILRFYGTGADELLSREKELYWLSQLTSLGVGPQMYGIFGNGRWEEFLESITLDKDNMRLASTSKHIARRMCELHSLVSCYRPFGSAKPSDKDAKYLNGQPELWAKVDSLMQLMQHKWPQVRNKCDSNPQCAELLNNWPTVVQAINKFRAHVEREVHSPVVFTHNDLQYGNILRMERTGKLEIVDFEFAGHNYRGYDIANHFCEWMVDYYHPEHPHLLDPALYPTNKQRHTFLRAYIRAKTFIDVNMKANAGIVESDSAQPVKIRTVRLSKDQIRQEVAELDREVALFVTASHLHWGMHGLLKACCCEIGFDYVSYAAQRLSMFLSQVADLQ
ncbi:hypothetical protein IW140_004713 [Coemansia sp. RSA 1813]|nr:hypothetical protein EV178_005397 [Coemansia sp. RSA 1646]KAJ1770399.1 hypothetical protein LPJ74_003206 [Coemansia sp. RSA 1843]KAJ2088215.1 hypothetical protein IW138_004387 [Coemansia sp. RSA 986]KAJ2215742.1 hypothetical protein EV179_001966 [Coemansia sp. RSA 487]KAJ2566922.1 hypothetical protein IW140_004713 [Coemansia sp. RSA 1813]